MGIFRGAVLVAFTVAATVGSTACQPMYGASPERIHNPDPTARPVGQGSAEIEKITYIEDCELHTRVFKVVPHDAARAEELVARADTSTSDAARATEPVRRGELLTDSVRTYGAALEKDPYSAEATLKLALAYDRVQRKGCALALLGRLAQLANHPRFERAATQQIDDIELNRAWFGGYRKDALKAVGRS
jgi:hypothetical protein